MDGYGGYPGSGGSGYPPGAGGPTYNDVPPPGQQQQQSAGMQRPPSQSNSQSPHAGKFHSQFLKCSIFIFVHIVVFLVVAVK